MTSEPTSSPEATERFYYQDPNAPKPNKPLGPGVSAVLFDEQRRILFLKRARSAYWSVPGGRMENGEAAHACCIRETLEETGLDSRVVRLVSISTDPGNIIEYPDGNIFQSFVICFEAEIVRGDLKLSEESEQFRWVGREHLDEINLLPDSRQNALDAWAGQEAAFIR